MAMTTMVCFRSAGAAYCMPVDATRAVRDISGMIALQAGRPDVAGTIPGNPPLTVISPLGVGGGSVVVVTHDPAMLTDADRVLQMRDGRLT